ncbi:MAG: uroporphyrinogen-III C-methyltransferase [Betaproteobacteria bacterium]|nr:uroporphyrinogen-III C-methyltransferase [Betaproteobacteria bacterium]
MGKVYLIGAGPGAPDLITLRGAEILRRADVVFYDALVHPETVALAPDAKTVAVGKRCSQVSTEQRFINRSLVEAARKHEIVVRLKGGDPMLFGRAQEEIDALEAAGIEFEVVPGVTAALAAAADLGVSLTRRGLSRSVTLATPRVGAGEEATDWAAGVTHGGTAVLYMGVGQAPEIAAALLSRGLSPHTPVSVVESASLPDSRSFQFPLSELRRAAENGIEGPAVILLGEVFRQAPAVQDDEFEDDFLAYGNSWFR